ncbi:PREDICTED: uncharacterized protein LOC106899986 [Calidris pugnax]|uniref:uncharacterized protein LOC106899986 n=1 Tax=Calidris pugnax TaxID=198806 RepID=UPI00071E1E17|nr:PREDICTED: uncharacterized protein LOC106899986 [Calidris pugnax]
MLGVSILQTVPVPTTGTTNPPPQRVNGSLGGSVLLSPLLLPNETWNETEWSFSGDTRPTIQVAKVGPDGFKRPNPKDRFKNRLKMLNQTTVKIEPLELGDSGVYKAQILLDTAEVMEQSFILSIYGTTNPPPQRVNGSLGGSVLLSPLLLPNETWNETEWSFSGDTRPTIQVAKVGPDGFKRPNPKDRFKNRLKMLNQTTVKIEPLELGDSGVYKAQILLDTAEVMEQSFILSIYGPLGELEIKPHLLSLTTHGCNLTLRCQVPADKDVEVTWEPRPPWGHLCGDNQTLCLDVPPSTFSSMVTCTAQNPIEKKNISIPLDNVCKGGWDMWLVCLVVVAVAVVALLGGVWLWRKKRRRRKKKRAEGGGWKRWLVCLVVVAVAVVALLGGVWLWRKKRRRRKKKRAEGGGWDMWLVCLVVVAVAVVALLGGVWLWRKKRRRRKKKRAEGAGSLHICSPYANTPAHLAPRTSDPHIAGPRMLIPPHIWLPAHWTPI